MVGQCSKLGGFCPEAQCNLIWSWWKPRVWNTSRNGLWINFSFEENLSKELFLTVFSPEARSLGLVEAVYLRNSNSMWTWKEINPSTSWSHNRISGTGGCFRKSLCREMSISLSLLSLKAASRSRLGFAGAASRVGCFLSWLGFSSSLSVADVFQQQNQL